MAKLKITETQLKVLIKEEYSSLSEYAQVTDSEKILNNILDKLSRHGQSSLSDEERETLSKYATPNSETNINDKTEFMDVDDVSLTSMFMDEYSEYDNIIIDDENWYIEQENNGEYLLVFNDLGVEFKIYPFNKETNKIIITNNDYTFSFNLTKNIENYNDMRKFVHSFKTQILPSIIKKVKKQYI